MELKEKRIHAEFFRSESGNQPVKEELLKLGRHLKTVIGEDIKFVEYHWKIDRPYVDQLRKGRGEWERTIYEVRSQVREGSLKTEFRVLFFVYENFMILVHMFQKKSSKTPKFEIDLAWERMKRWIRAEKEG